MEVFKQSDWKIAFFCFSVLNLNMTISTLSTDTQQKIYDQILQTLGGKANPENQ